MRTIFTIFIFSAFSGLNAQENKLEQVWVKLNIIDKVDNRLIENAQIVSYETMLFYTTDSTGIFRNTFYDTDSIKVFGMGYEAVVIKVKDLASFEEGAEEIRKVFLTRKSYLLANVDVPASKEINLHMPDDIKVNVKNTTPVSMRSDDFSKKPPVVAAVLSPVSFIHYYASQTEKRKRNFRKVLEEEKKNSQIYTMFSREIVHDITGYEGEELDDFMVYCNINIKLSPNDNPLIIKQKITELKNKYENGQ